MIGMKDMGRMMRPLQRKISTMIGRAVLRAINDGSGTQTMQVELLKDELYDGVERFQEYGFTSVPHAGAETVMVSVGGQRGCGIIVACEDKRYRITGLENGEVALYTDENETGHRIHMKRGREIELVSGTTSIMQTPTGVTVTVGAQVLEVTNSVIRLTVGGQVLELSATGLKHNGVNIGSTHPHYDPSNTIPATGRPVS